MKSRACVLASNRRSNRRLQKYAKKEVLFDPVPGANLESSKQLRMESVISAKDLQAKLDRKQEITVVETLAPERYRAAHMPGRFEHSSRTDQGTCPAVVAQQGCRSSLTALTRIDTPALYAARELAAMGYKNRAHYPEGKPGRMEAGFPMEKAA